MTKQDFAKKFGAYALSVQKTDGVPALFTLAQSAYETGWGATVVGNMMFGVKDTDGINGNEQLLTTTEYHNSPNVKYPAILAITEVIKGKRWKYKIKDWFRKYPTPEESFRDHAVFLKKNKRYSSAFLYKDQPYRFAQEVCRAGYATDPNYWPTLQAIMKSLDGMI